MTLKKLSRISLVALLPFCGSASESINVGLGGSNLVQLPAAPSQPLNVVASLVLLP